jgi:hypothetical protein
VQLNKGAPISNMAGCDYYDSAGKHDPIFSGVAFYPVDQPAVYPNPSDTGYVKFINLIPGSQISIYTLSGEFVNSMDVPGINAVWNCKNIQNEGVSAGIYYYIVKNKNSGLLYTGKLFIMTRH